MAKHPRHVTQEHALYALNDVRTPPAEALALFERAFRRSNAITRTFVLHLAGGIRIAMEERDAIDRWADDGGAVRDHA